MPKARSIFVAVLAATLGNLAAPATAQEINPLVRERINVNVGSERRETPVRVQVGVNFFIPGPSGDSEEASKLRDRARRTIYEMASKECKLVVDVFATACRLEAINVNVNRQQMTGQVEGMMVNGNFTLQTMPK